MTFLIFGGTGFIGSDLTIYLRTKGHEVFTVSRSGSNSDFSLDITDAEGFDILNNINPEVIVNCASKIPTGNTDSINSEILKEFYQTNVIGGLNICNWALKKNVRKIINCSTLAVNRRPWPDPLNEDYCSIPDGQHVGYAMSKLSQESIIKESLKNSTIKFCNLRLSAVYGDNMPEVGIIFFLIKKFKLNQPIDLINAESVEFDFINVQDVSKSILAISKNDSLKEIVNLGSGVPIKLIGLAYLLKRLTNSSSIISNNENHKPLFKARIQITLLKSLIGDVFNQFLPLDKGLLAILKNTK